MNKPMSVCELIGCEYFRDNACRNLLAETIPCLSDRKAVADGLVDAVQKVAKFGFSFDSRDQQNAAYRNEVRGLKKNAKQALSQIEGSKG